jgi:WD40 repeat protein
MASGQFLVQWDNTLKVWDLTTRKEEFTLTGHSDSVNAVAVTADGKRAISGSTDKTLKVWDLSSGNVIASFTVKVRSPVAPLHPMESQLSQATNPAAYISCG